MAAAREVAAEEAKGVEEEAEDVEVEGLAVEALEAFVLIARKGTRRRTDSRNGRICVTGTR